MSVLRTDYLNLTAPFLPVNTASRRWISASHRKGNWRTSTRRVAEPEISWNNGIAGVNPVASVHTCKIPEQIEWKFREKVLQASQASFDFQGKCVYSSYPPQIATPCYCGSNKRSKPDRRYTEPESIRLPFTGFSISADFWQIGILWNPCSTGYYKICKFLFLRING